MKISTLKLTILRIILCLGVLSQTLFAQAPAHFFQHLSVETGLSQGQNAFVFQDSRRRMWISSVDGLNCFDGTKIKTYRHQPGKANSLTDNHITGGFFEDRQGNVWFSTKYAIACAQSGQGIFINHQLKGRNGKPISSGYYAFFLDAEQKLWVSVRDSVFTFDTQNRKQKFICSVGPGDRIVPFVQKGLVSALIQCFYRRGLDVYNFQEGKIIRSSFLSNQQTNYVYPEKDTLIWAGSDQGLTALNLKTGRETSYHEFQGNKISVYDIEPEGDFLWLSTKETGVLKFDKIKRQFLYAILPIPDRPGTLRKNSLHEIYLSPMRDLWVSLWPIGLDYTNLNRARFSLILSPQNSKQSVNVLSIVEDSEGKIWASTPDGIEIFDGEANHKAFIPYTHFRTKGRAIRQGYLQRSPTGKIVLVLMDRVVFFDEKNLQILREVPSGVYRLEKAVYLQDGTLILTNYDSTGLLSIDRSNKVARYKAISPLNDKLVYWLGQDQYKRLFVCLSTTNFLVLQRSEGKWKTTVDLPGFNDISDVHNSPRSDEIWVAYSDGLALVNLSSKKVDFQSGKHGLPEGRIYSILEDPSDNSLWLSSNQGLINFHESKTRLYELGDGLQGNEFNRWTDLLSSQGRIWFGGPSGINSFRSSEIRRRGTSPYCYLAGIKINNHHWEGFADTLQNITLRAFQRSISFDIRVTDYARPAPHNFRYQMEGIDEVPIIGNDANSIRYPKLPPGTYYFTFHAPNIDGKYTLNKRSIRVKVLPPWYQTWPFYLLLTATILSIIIGIQRFYLLQALNRQKMAEFEAQAIRSSINPHFVSNALNALKKFIVKTGDEQPENYLDKFASLIRRVLEHSKQLETSLKEELELLSEYIQIEGLRYGHKFDYEQFIERSIDPTNLIIPYMVLQPCVENAIDHGLAPKRGGRGLLKINMQIERDTLLISILDNGIGRKKSREQKQRMQENGGQVPKHTSVGLELIESYIVAFAKKYKGKGTLNIIDLLDEAGNSLGTQVDIQLPLVYKK